MMRGEVLKEVFNINHFTNSKEADEFSEIIPENMNENRKIFRWMVDNSDHIYTQIYKPTLDKL